MKMIKGICFDLDGVYFLNGKENFVKSMVGLGVSEEEVRRVFLKSDEMNFKYKKGIMTDDEFWSWAIKEWKLNLEIHEVVDRLISGYEANLDAANYVKAARKSGYKTLICSNNFPARIRGLQERFGFLDDFDVAVFSYEVGAIKPEQEMFKALIKEAKLNADEIAYADDSADKLQGAKDLGINTFVYTDFQAFVKSLEFLGVTV